MELLLPRIRDTLGSAEIYTWMGQAINKWVIDHFGNALPWEWASRLTCKFRLTGRKTLYAIRRSGKFWEVWSYRTERFDVDNDRTGS